MTIPELIEKLEKVIGPDRELDACIAFTTGEFDFKLKHGFEDCRIERGARREDDFVEVHVVNKGTLIYGERYPRYTASIDAAVQLCERVLPDYLWGITQGTDGDVEFQGNIWPNTQPFDASKDHFGYHSKPALALCIAILRALQPKEGE